MLCQNNVHPTFTGHPFCAGIPQSSQIEAGEERFTGTEQYRPYNEVQLIDEPGPQILSNRRRTAADANVEITGRSFCLFESRVNSLGDKVERRSARHHDWLSGMMSQDKCGHVIRRFVAPPSFPIFVRPRTANWPEHITSEYPRSLARHALDCKAVVDAGLT